LINGNLIPVVSADRYRKEWVRFVNWQKNRVGYKKGDEKNVPTEPLLMLYFDYCHGVLPTTLWQYYSILNLMMKVECKGEAGNHAHIQQFAPKVKLRLQGYDRGYNKKKAGIFTKEEYERFLQCAPDTCVMILKKVASVLGWYGGLRPSELLAVQFESVKYIPGEGIWVDFLGKKQRGKENRFSFLVPEMEDKGNVLFLLRFCLFLLRFCLFL